MDNITKLIAVTTVNDEVMSIHLVTSRPHMHEIENAAASAGLRTKLILSHKDFDGAAAELLAELAGFRAHNASLRAPGYNESGAL